MYLCVPTTTLATLAISSNRLLQHGTVVFHSSGSGDAGAVGIGGTGAEFGAEFGGVTEHWKRRTKEQVQVQVSEGRQQVGVKGP